MPFSDATLLAAKARDISMKATIFTLVSDSILN
jgi:hypothetical protein